MAFGSVYAPLGAADAAYDGLMSAEDKRDLETLKELVPFALMERTASGNPAPFVDGLAGAVKNLRVTLTPSRSGSGDPYPPGGGKNLLPIAISSSSVSGFTHALNADGSVTVVGNAGEMQAGGSPHYLTTGLSLAPGNYKFVVNWKPGSYGAQVDLWLPSNGAAGANSRYYDAPSPENASKAFTALEGDEVRLYVRTSSVESAETMDATFTAMIIRADETDESFAPYSNVRSISGVSSVSVTRPGKNLFGWSTISGTTMKAWPMKLPPGAYSLGARVTSDDINKTRSAFLFHYVSGGYSDAVLLRRGTRDAASFTLEKDVDEVVFYASENYAYSVGGSFTFEDIQIESGSVPSDYEPYQGQTVTVSLVDSNNNALTVYGGTLDVTTGELTVTHAGVNLGDLSWSARDADPGYYYSSSLSSVVKHPATNNDMADALCEAYPTVTLEQAYGNRAPLGIAIQTSPSVGYVAIRDRNKANLSAADFAATLSGVMFVYPLKKPATYTLTPAQMQARSGFNAFYADSGTLSVTYRADPALAYADLKSNLTNAILSLGAGI